MIFPSALCHPHPDPEALARCLEGLGFRRTQSASPGLLLENGSLALRLTQGQAERPLRLEAQVRDLSSEAQALGAPWQAESEERLDPHWARQRLHHPLGLTLTLLREYSEDELDLLPPLPTHLDWQPEAVAALQQVLRQVPLDFRDAARRRATERAEYLCVVDGGLAPEPHHALQGLVDVTPAFQHPLLADAIRALGYAPEPLFAARQPA